MTLRKFKEEEQVALGPVSKETKYDIWVLYSQDPRFYDDLGGMNDKHRVWPLLVCRQSMVTERGRISQILRNRLLVQNVHIYAEMCVIISH